MLSPTRRGGSYDLKKRFRVFEDGKPSIGPTSQGNIGGAGRSAVFARPPSHPMSRATNVLRRPVYVLVLDDLHTNFQRSPRVKIAARQFIERYLGANDLMAVVTTGGSTRGAQEFTNRKRLLLAAVDKFAGRKLEAATLTRGDALQRIGSSSRNGRIDDPEDAERGHNARSTLTHLKGVAEWFGGVRGRRKSIVFVSEGIDYDITDVFNNRSASTIMDETREAIAAATRSNVSIYTVDPRGLTALGDDTIGSATFGADQGASNGGSRSFDRPGISSLMSELRLSQDSLRTLSDETGGFAAINANDFTTAFERIVRDNSGYYVLAYYPPSDKRDGKFHKIEVRVTRPGLDRAARPGYVSPRGIVRLPNRRTKGRRRTARGAEQPIQVSGLTMHVFAAPFKGTAPNLGCLFGVELRGRDLSRRRGTGRAHVSRGRCRRQDSGKQDDVLRSTCARRHSPAFKPPASASSTGWFAAGRYQMRLAARDPRRAIPDRWCTISNYTNYGNCPSA